MKVQLLVQQQKSTPSYRMPARYVQYVEQLVRGNERLGTAGFEAVVLDNLMIDRNCPPEDFPSFERWRDDVYSTKGKIKKGRGESTK